MMMRGSKFEPLRKISILLFVFGVILVGVGLVGLFIDGVSVVNRSYFVIGVLSLFYSICYLELLKEVVDDG